MKNRPTDDTKSNEEVKNVVIIGGGASGFAVAREIVQALKCSTMENMVKVTFVAPSPVYVNLASVIDALLGEGSDADGEDNHRLAVRYDEVLGDRCEIKIARVVKITPADHLETSGGGDVSLDSGETPRYDALVLTPGREREGLFDFEACGSEEEVCERVKMWRDDIEKARGVVLYGGRKLGVGM